MCAPSNAAVDELMKKIILEFKEKCKDKKSPQGMELEHWLPVGWVALEAIGTPFCWAFF